MVPAATAGRDSPLGSFLPSTKGLRRTAQRRGPRIWMFGAVAIVALASPPASYDHDARKIPQFGRIMPLRKERRFELQGRKQPIGSLGTPRTHTGGSSSPSGGTSSCAILAQLNNRPTHP